MANRETKISNFFETTTASLLPAGNTNVTLSSSPGFNAVFADENTWFYLVIDPDNSGSREIIVVKESTGTSLSIIERDLETSYSGTGPDHQTGTTVRLAVLKQHFEDMNDRLDTGLASLANAIETTEVGNGLSWSGTELEVDINGATDGTAITVDGANDLVLVYDNDASAVKKVKTSQIATPADVHPFLVMGG